MNCFLFYSLVLEYRLLCYLSRSRSCDKNQLGLDLGLTDSNNNNSHYIISYLFDKQECLLFYIVFIL